MAKSKTKKTYTAIHENPKAAQNHIKKIKLRGGTVTAKQGLFDTTLNYSFKSNGKHKTK